MKITVTPITESKRILDKCRLTVNKEPSKSPRPSTVFLDNIYMAEHSPIREKLFDIYIEDIPYCISTHFVRHHQGVEKYVTTSRSDRTDIKDRSQRSQMDLVSMGMTVNAQALINMSKVRLCYCADKDARKVVGDRLCISLIYTNRTRYTSGGNEPRPEKLKHPLKTSVLASVAVQNGENRLTVNLTYG